MRGAAKARIVRKTVISAISQYSHEYHLLRSAQMTAMR